MKHIILFLVTALLVSGCTTVKVAVVAAPPGTAPAAVQNPPEEKKTEHAAVDAQVKVSSTHSEWEGEGPAANLVDGKLNTRWSSEYAEPQQVAVDLGKARRLAKLRLHWEAAAAAKYSVAVSADGTEWTVVGEKTAGKPGPRIDEFDLPADPVQSIKLDLQQRAATNWGFSLYEIEVLAPREAAPAADAPPPE